MKTTEQMIEVMQAYVDGKPIEVTLPDGHWGEAESLPFWDWIMRDYRIAPLTKPSINWDHVAPEYKWMATDKDGFTWLFSDCPYCGTVCWNLKIDALSSTQHRVNSFSSFVPGTCDWKYSLVRRGE